MSWSTNGYIPDPFDTLMNNYYTAFINKYGADITKTRFEASREYQSFYSTVQIDMQLQSEFAQVFTKVTEWIIQQEINISTPTTVTTEIVRRLKEATGYDVSSRPMTEENAGTIEIAIDYTSNEYDDQIIVDILANQSISGGIVTIGDITRDYVLSNGQQFSYAWTNGKATPIKFKMTIQVSRNTTSVVETTDQIQERFINNWDKFYSMGLDVEPEKYYEVVRDAPFASEILTEYSLDDGVVWSDDPLLSAFDTRYDPVLELADIKIVEV